MPLRDQLKTYYRITKPGIIYGNVMTATGGFLLASRGHVDIGLYLATVLGMALVMASGCVYNNYIDRGIDRKMNRTKKRATAQGVMTGRQALIYGSVLGIIGFTVLAILVNTLLVILGLIALVVYVALYGIAKRRSYWGTIVGSVSGALPITAGYVAVTGNIDMGAFLLFLILTLWQMPHFYAIAMFRLQDYKAANIPVMPAVLGAEITKLNILLYIVAFTAAAAMLTVFDYTGYLYLVVMLILGALWLRKGIRGFRAANDEKWAGKMFGFSLMVLTIFSFMISVETFLP